jgi:hypothetical protein
MLKKSEWVARPDIPGERHKKLTNGNVVRVTIIQLGDELYEQGKDGTMWALRDGQYMVAF